MKENLFNGLLDYKPEKAKKISTKSVKILGGSGKTKPFPKARAKQFKATKVKEPHFREPSITTPPKHESGYF